MAVDVVRDRHPRPSPDGRARGRHANPRHRQQALLLLVAAALAAAQAARDRVRRGRDPRSTSRPRRRRSSSVSPAGKVPILIDGDVTVWESLAIMEYVGEPMATAGLAERPQGPRHGALGGRRDACRLRGAALRLPDEPRQEVRRHDRGAACAGRRPRFEAIVRDGAASASARAGRSCSAPSRPRTPCTPPRHAPRDLLDPGRSGPAPTWTRSCRCRPSGEWRRAALPGDLDRRDDEVDEEPIEVYRQAA